MLDWRLPSRLTLIVGLLCLNLTVMHPAYNRSDLQYKKIWQYGLGVIQDFDWLGQNLILATSSGLWQTTPTFNQPAIRFSTIPPQPSLDVVTRESRTSKIISSPDGTRFISRDGDGDFRIRDAHNAEVLVTFPAGEAMQNASWQPNGEFIAAEAYNATDPVEQQYKVALWDAHTGKLVTTIGKYSFPIVAISWHPAGALLAVRLSNGLIVIEDVRQNKTLHEIMTDSLTTSLLVWSPDGSLLATITNSSLKLWRTETFDVLITPNQPAFVATLAWNADSQRLAGVLQDGTIETWNANTGEMVRLDSLKDITNSNIPVRIEWNGEQLAVLNTTEQILVWNTTTNKLVGKSVAFKSDVRAMSASPDGRYIALAYSGSNEITLLDGQTGLFNRILATDPALMLDVTDISWNNSGQLLAVGSGKTVYIWQLQASSKPIRIDDVYNPHFSWSPSDTIAIVSRVFEKEQLQFFDGKTGKQTLFVRQEPGLASALWSPDGTQIAMYRYNLGGSDANTLPTYIDVWNLSKNTITTVKFPVVGTSQITPTESFLWLPHSATLVGYAAPLLWKWSLNEDEATVLTSLSNTQSNPTLPLKSNTDGDWLAIVNGEATIFRSDTGQEILRFPDISALSSIFSWGANSELFVYDGTVQAYSFQ